MTKEQWMHMYQIVGAAQEVYNVLGRGWKNQYIKKRWKRNLILEV